VKEVKEVKEVNTKKARSAYIAGFSLSAFAPLRGERGLTSFTHSLD
jgi:hypothetical protein